MCMSLKEKRVLFDSYNNFFENYSKRYCKAVSEFKAYKDKETYRQCFSFCKICNYELHGIVLFLKDIGVFTWKESEEELKKIDVEFCLCDLINLYFCKEEV